MYYTRSHYSRDMQALHFMRRKMVVYAQQHSIKAAARRFEASRNTVRLWLRRYQADPSARLVNARPPSTNHPQKMSYGWQQTICDAVRLCLARSQRVIASRIKGENSFPRKHKNGVKNTQAKRPLENSAYEEGPETKPAPCQRYATVL